jgi:hypothetical protein
MPEPGTPEWYSLTPQQRHAQTDKWKAQREKYRRTGMDAAYSRRYRKRQKLRSRNNLPTAVVRPYMMAAAARAAIGEQCHDQGYTALARELRVDHKLVSRIIQDPEKKSVSQVVCDRLCIYIGIPLGQLVDDAVKWAKEHNDSWPEGYRNGPHPK